jgi:hypothetical protein
MYAWNKEDHNKPMQEMTTEPTATKTHEAAQVDATKPAHPIVLLLEILKPTGHHGGCMGLYRQTKQTRYFPGQSKRLGFPWVQAG